MALHFDRKKRKKQRPTKTTAGKTESAQKSVRKTKKKKQPAEEERKEGVVRRRVATAKPVEEVAPEATENTPAVEEAIAPDTTKEQEAIEETAAPVESDTSIESAKVDTKNEGATSEADVQELNTAKQAPTTPVESKENQSRLPPNQERPSTPPIIRKKLVSTPATLNHPEKKEFSRLGKAVIAPPPHYTAKKREAAKKTTSPVAQPTLPPNPEKEDRWKKKQDPKTDKIDKLDKKSPRKRNRPKLRSLKIEMRVEEVPVSTRRVRRSRGGKKKASPKPKALKRRIFIDSQITVGDLAHQMSVKSGEVIKKLISFDMMCTQNDTIDFDTAQMVAEMFEYEVIDNSTNEKDFLIKEETKEELEGDPRPSVVTIMGHVDHGKTTLLDTIRKANVASGEAGGITQHLSAYQVQKNGEKITFIDTPGHEAFTAMRSRGAQVTDIVVLVVAADDGVMPQTKEALSHAKAAGVDIIVAINKCDKPGANPEKVKQELMNLELIPEEYGGDTIFVEISALKGEGIDELLESILLTAEMGEYVAPVDSHAQGTVLEARLDKGKGPVATVIIKQGKLKRGDSLVLGKVWGRVRAMTDYNGKKIKEALPSMPVEIIGLQETPVAGDDFTVVKNDKDARALVDLRIEEEKKKSASKPKKLTLEDLLMHQEQGEVLTLNLIVKTDVGGTLEAIRGSLEKINIEGTEIKVLHAAVGAITEGDIGLAHTYGGIVIGFNIRPDSKARKAINELNVDVKTYKVIYEAIEDIQKALKGLLSPEQEEVVHGLAEIREIFHTKFGTVAGSVVTEGKLNKKYGIRLLRNSIVIWDGKIGSLRRFKDNVREVEKGKDCGIILEGFNDIKPLDVIESYSFEDKAII